MLKTSRILLALRDVSETPEFQEWYRGSKLVDPQGKPIRLYRGMRGDPSKGLPAAATQGQPQHNNVTFCTSDPEVAASYATVNQSYSGGIGAFYVKADRLIEYTERPYRWTRFDAQAMGLGPGEVLVAKGVVDPGPGGAGLGTSDIYAFNYGTQVVPAIGSVHRVFNHHLKDLQPEAHGRMEADIKRWQDLEQRVGRTPYTDENSDTLDTAIGILCDAEYLARDAGQDYWKQKYGFDPDSDLDLYAKKIGMEYSGFPFLEQAYKADTSPVKEAAWKLIKESLSV